VALPQAIICRPFGAVRGFQNSFLEKWFSGILSNECRYFITKMSRGVSEFAYKGKAVLQAVDILLG
jgi:hypothetical protein